MAQTTVAKTLSAAILAAPRTKMGSKKDKLTTDMVAALAHVEGDGNEEDGTIVDVVADGLRAARKLAKTPAKGAKNASKGAKGSTPAQAAKTPAKPGARFYIKDSFRPGSGRMLFAYTMAWLQESGLIDGADIGRSDAVKLAGGTAITYHTTKTGRMVEKDGRVSLAPQAANFFADRGADSKDVEAFRAILRDGKPDGQRVKQEAGIGKLEA